MPRTEIDAASLEYIYKEYVRLSERCASYVQSSFDDIKLFGISGLAFAWAPIVDYLRHGQDQSALLFYGFLAILLVLCILGIFNLLKQSLVIYYLQHLRAYETEIQTDLGEIGRVAFGWTGTYVEWRKKVVVRIVLHLLIVVGLSVIVFPIVMLALVQRAYSYAATYLSVSVSLLFIYGHAARVLLKEQR